MLKCGTLGCAVNPAERVAALAAGGQRRSAEWVPRRKEMARQHAHLGALAANPLQADLAVAGALEHAEADLLPARGANPPGHQLHILPSHVSSGGAAKQGRRRQ